MFQKNWQELIKPQKLRIEAGHEAASRRPSRRNRSSAASPHARNALRRVLLSSLQGAAITSIQIEGVLQRILLDRRRARGP